MKHVCVFVSLNIISSAPKCAFVCVYLNTGAIEMDCFAQT